MMHENWLGADISLCGEHVLRKRTEIVRFVKVISQYNIGVRLRLLVMLLVLHQVAGLCPPLQRNGWSSSD
jgi:hypothetical protein